MYITSGDAIVAPSLYRRRRPAAVGFALALTEAVALTTVALTTVALTAVVTLALTAPVATVVLIASGEIAI